MKERSIYHILLKQYWGYDDFRELQEEIICSIGAGKDTLGLMPTGGGKSITFQVPALAKEGICIVVSPLIALMKDQVQTLRNKGIKAIAIYSGMTREEIIVALENCIFGDYKFLYISPERLDTDLFRAKLRSMKVSMLTIDESHCISQWGYDFRPAYLKIAETRKLLPNIPVLALTATATPEVVKDIQQKLHFKTENLFSMSFERKNVAYVVRKTEDKQTELLHIMSRINGSAIVYVRSRKRSVEMANLLKENNIEADFYHAGVQHEVKDQKQKRWTSGECRVIVATNAFGMGIDKPDVRLVVHLDFPNSPEAYFQEAGRAGRDGKKAYAVLLYTPIDVTTLKKRIAETFPAKEYTKKVYEDLNFYLQVAMDSGMGKMVAFDLDDFCRRFKHYPVPAHSALKILSQTNYIEYTDEQDSLSRLLFTVTREELYKINQLDLQTDALIQRLLRNYTGLFTDYAFINEDSLALHVNLTRKEVYEKLVELKKRRIIDYIPRKKTPFIIYKEDRVELKHLQLTKLVYEERKIRFEERINAMVEYVTSSSSCRSILLLTYFGEKTAIKCGQCDVCLSQKPHNITQSEFDQLAKRLFEILGNEAVTPHDLMKRIGEKDAKMTQTIRFLIDTGVLKYSQGLVSKV